jgi:hypothetical protein
MKRELVEYINGERNAVKDEFILSREKNGSSELVFVNIPDIEKPMYALWNSRKQAKRHKVKTQSDTEVKIETVIPKGTGGEPAYAMIILNEIEKLKISIEASGLLLKLFSCLEWNTGRLIRKRDNVSLTVDMVMEQFDLGKRKTKTLLAELNKCGATRYDPKTKAYYLNGNIVKKGMMK